MSRVKELFKLTEDYKRAEKVLLPHSFLGSSDLSLQSLTESHTFELSIHSPFLHRNFSGPSHLVAVRKKQALDQHLLHEHSFA